MESWGTINRGGLFSFDWKKNISRAIELIHDTMAYIATNFKEA